MHCYRVSDYVREFLFNMLVWLRPGPISSKRTVECTTPLHLRSKYVWVHHLVIQRFHYQNECTLDNRFNQSSTHGSLEFEKMQDFQTGLEPKKKVYYTLECALLSSYPMILYLSVCKEAYIYPLGA